MPLSRYQIRNEYSLADPELYRAADKDDPEALLEGIAMAGLVGVLRQLGDLAEFAAEIFHDLHEQVMSTASRGHSLMVRVQQLEAEFPTIEKAFLCQTNHSSFYYNAGTEWHPNLRMDQNLITQGDLPRFVMDSYEECRGPPRLFLLDKFDVAGAGACLKRYTDPSFFKVETSYSDVVRDKKTRKAKRKISRWRNGETPEILPTSHAKLHQLFLEERLENGTLHSGGRVKLKRRLNGFPFDIKSGKSYMEKFLKPHSPDHDEVHEIPEDLSPLALPYDNTYQSTFEVVEISVVSPEKKSKQRMRSSDFSPAGGETSPELVVDELNEVLSAEGSVEVSKLNLDFQAYENFHAVSSEKDISVDGGPKREDSVDDDQSDDVASEIENYVDALATMDSEIDTDSEMRTQSTLRFMNSRGHTSNADANDIQAQPNSVDSQSTGNSTLSDDGSISPKKDLSSFSSSDTHSTAAENIPLDSEVSSCVLTTAEIHEAEPLRIQQSIDKERQLPQLPEDTHSDGALVEASEIPSHSFEFYDPNGSSSPKDSVIVYKNAETIGKDTASAGIEIDHMVTLSRDLPFTSSVAEICEENGEYLSPKLSGESLDDFLGEGAAKIDNIGFAFCPSVPSFSKYDSPLQVPSEKQFVNELEDVGVDQDENAVASADGLIVHHSTEENLSSLTNIQPLDGEKLSTVTSNSDVLLQNTDEVSPTTSRNLPVNGFGPSYDLGVSVGEASAEKKINENALEYVLQVSLVEGNYGENIVASQNSDLPLPKDQLSDPTNEGIGSHCSIIEVDEVVSEVDNSTPSGERLENSTVKVDAPIISESVESCDPKTEVDSEPHEPLKELTLYLEEGRCDRPSNIVDSAIVDKTASDSDLVVSSTTAGTSLLAEVNANLEDVELEPLSAAATVNGPDDDGSTIDDGFPCVDLKRLQEGSLTYFKDERSGLETDTCLSNKPADSGFDDVYQQKFTSSGLNNLHDMVIGDDLGPQICNDDRYLHSGEENDLNVDEVPTTHITLQQYEQEPHCLEEDIDLQLGTELHSTSDGNSGLFTVLQQAHVPDNDDHLGTFDTSSESPVKNVYIGSSAPEQLSQVSNKIDVLERSDPSNPVSLSFSLLPDCGQIYVEEMPPLPPLPPVQWRMGKFQNSSPARESIVESHNAAFPPQFSSRVNQEDQDLNPLSAQPALSDVKSTLLPEQPTCGSSSSSNSFLSKVSPVVHHGYQKDTILPVERFQDTGSSGLHGEILGNDFQGEEGGKEMPNLDSFHQLYVMDSANSISLSDGLVKPHNQMVLDTSLSDLELGPQSAHSADNAATCDTTEITIKVGNEDTKPTIEDNLSLPTEDGGMLNGNRTTKLPRPRNPLIDAVVALDKSKLRKVPERVKPQIKTEAERNSLLEQIRTKSFNLKPAAVTRPSIQGPKTNLKVAAILEKAKTIRQAFAGSDEEEEDDNDSWSDS